MVVDVIKFFDTVDMSILDCALGLLGVADWLRRAYFSCHGQVRLRFKRAGAMQGCPLSMIFIVVSSS